MQKEKSRSAVSSAEFYSLRLSRNTRNASSSCATLFGERRWINSHGFFLSARCYVGKGIAARSRFVSSMTEGGGGGWMEGGRGRGFMFVFARAWLTSGLHNRAKCRNVSHCRAASSPCPREERRDLGQSALEVQLLAQEVLPQWFIIVTGNIGIYIGGEVPRAESKWSRQGSIPSIYLNAPTF